MNTLLLYPMFSMVFLTFIIASIAVKVRFSSIKVGNVNPKYFRLMGGQDVPDIITKTTRNFNNQFEIPTLFYVVCTLYICLSIESFIALLLYCFIFCLVIYSFTYGTFLYSLNLQSYLTSYAHFLGFIYVCFSSLGKSVNTKNITTH